ncbi:MAG: cytochrome c [Bacteroidetes bacterium]|nr:cytochrome c [Bacteroidota bacterium]
MEKTRIFTTQRARFIKFIGITCLFFAGCSGTGGNEPVNDSTVTDGSYMDEISASYERFGPVDNVLFEKGRELFTHRCTRCHSLDVKVVGPALRGVTKRRSSGWIENKLMSIQILMRLDSTGNFVCSKDTQVVENHVSDTLNQPPVTTQEERRALIEFLRKEG